jgi:hypothetical protein
MLFCYPVAAAAENWLHECLVEMVKVAIDTIDAGGQIAAWPACIPDPYRDRLQSRTGISERYRAFCSAAHGISIAERQIVLAAVTSQNSFPEVFNGTVSCVSKDDLPASIQGPARDLFEFGFSLLTAFKVRDRQYQVIYDSIKAHVCPFCGIEAFDAPGVAREDLDHYLAISLYPFAGANLRNLAPMGHKCNAAHKGAIDVLCDSATGLRRKCVDPYSGPIATVSLLDSVPFEGDLIGAILLPRWKIDLNGPQDEIFTWDKIFSIRTRYKANVLDAEFRSWMDTFAQWCQCEVGELKDEAGVVEALARYLTAVVQEGYADRVFLKKAVFEMLKKHCVGMPVSERLVAWFVSLVSPNEGAIVVRSVESLA